MADKVNNFNSSRKGSFSSTTRAHLGIKPLQATEGSVVPVVTGFYCPVNHTWSPQDGTEGSIKIGL